MNKPYSNKYNLVDMGVYAPGLFDRFPVYSDLLIVSITLRELLQSKEFNAEELQGFGPYMRDSLNGVIRCCAVVITGKYTDKCSSMPINEKETQV